MVNVKELALTLAGLTNQETLDLITELNVLGFKAPESQAVVVQETAKEEKIEKTHFDIFVQEVSSETKNKLKTITVWKNLTGLSLSESKALFESAPVVVKSNVPKEEAESIKAQLEEWANKVVLQ